MSYQTTDKFQHELTTTFVKALNDKYRTDCEYLDENGLVPYFYEDPVQSDFIFMITIKYKNSTMSRLGNARSHVHHLNRILDQFYKELCRSIGIRNKKRQRRLMPFGFFMIDGAGTRSGGTHSTDVVGISTHHHGLVYFHPEMLKSFFLAHENGIIDYIVRKIPRIESVHIDRLKDIPSITKTADYCTKYTAQLMSRNEAPDEVWISYPRMRDGEMDKLLGRNNH